MNSNLLSFYYKLLQEYDKILGLTDRLLYSLRSKEDDDAINSLLDKRHKSLQMIQKMSRSLSDFNPPNSEKVDSQMVRQLRSLHKKLEEKTNLLQKKEKELEKLAEDLS